MQKSLGLRILLALAILVQIVPLLLLPSAGAAVFLSPDETAVAVSARQFAQQGSMRISDPLLADFPWLHPRSFISQDGALVPVGFLGLPMILGVLERIFGASAIVFFTPLLAISLVYPLIRFTERWKPASRLLIASAWLSFPTVVMYADRALFPNLAAVCLTVWALYIVWQRRSAARCVVAGMLFGLALAVRPIEAVWMLPWLWLAWRSRKDAQRHQEKKFLVLTALGAAVVCVLCAVVAYRTYGNAFAVGYWLHDPIAREVASVSAAAQGNTSSSLWPFGFHPRNIWFNVKNYVDWYLLPWTLLTLVVAFLLRRSRPARPFIYVSAWTFVVLALVYGEAIYQDHVGVNVTSTGNSFLRYLLPLSIVIVFALGALAEQIQQRLKPAQAFSLIGLLVVGLYVCGNWTALFRDDEGVFPSMLEMRSYIAIRAAAQKTLPPETVVLSERSDKIFYPVFRVASPLPSLSDVQALAHQKPVALYSRPLSAGDLTDYAQIGITPREVMHGARESLYALLPSRSIENP